MHPPLLFIVADDLGFTDLSYKGGEFPTPHIDALAYSGIRLENYYVQLVCSPSRTAFMTGRYPLRQGLEHIVIWQDVSVAISRRHPTMAEVLRDEYDYNASYLVGKWHNGHAAWDETPAGRGFEGGWFGWNGGSEDYYNHTISGQAPHTTWTKKSFSMFDGLGPRAGRPDPVARPSSLPIPAWSAHGVYSTTLWGGVATKLIERHPFDTTPFFCYLAFQAPHAPVQPSPDAAVNAACARRTHGAGRDVYCSMVTVLDLEVGRVVAALRARQQYERALIVLTSDNGGCMPQENRGCNWPLRGGKHHNFEGGVRVTGLISGGAVPAFARGATSHVLMHATDWLPTLLAAVSNGSWTPPPGLRDVLDGVNVWPAIVNISNLNTSSVDPARTYSPRYEIPHNVDPLLRAADPREPQGALRHGRYKLVVGDLDVGWLRCDMAYEKPAASQSTAGALNRTFLLYDLVVDPHERTDLSSSPLPAHRRALELLLARWAVWKARTVAPDYPDSDRRSYPDHWTGVYAGAWKPWL